MAITKMKLHFAKYLLISFTLWEEIDMKFTTLATLTTLTAIVCGAGAHAETDMTISHWTGPKHPVSKGYAPMVGMLDANGFKV